MTDALNGDKGPAPLARQIAPLAQHAAQQLAVEPSWVGPSQKTGERLKISDPEFHERTLAETDYESRIHDAPLTKEMRRMARAGLALRKKRRRNLLKGLTQGGEEQRPNSG
jgi:hypothetical protein